MTDSARQLLNDCRHALTLFSAQAVGSQHRVAYLAAVAQLRAVYFALKKRDVPGDSRLRGAFERWSRELGASKPAPEIYWGFIVAERDQLLKEHPD